MYSSEAPKRPEKPMTPSQFDIEVLNLIRMSVDSFIRSAADELDRDGYRVLDIAPQIHEGAKKYFKKAKVETLDINPDADCDHTDDLCNLSMDTILKAGYDVVICTEVLEHTENPFKAMEGIKHLLKPGGFAFISTPFNFRIHGPLPDNWRFTEHGLRHLVKSSGLQFFHLGETTTTGRNLMPIHYRLVIRKEKLKT